MKDFRGIEPDGYVNLGGFNGPFYADLAQRAEYWHTGKLYRLGSEERINRFIEFLKVQNETDASDVAIGPAYEFADERGHNLDVPIIDLELGHIGIYHAVGDPSESYETKKQVYRIHGNDWDGVPQLASMALNHSEL